MDFPDLTKWWVLNRIANETLQQLLESILKEHGQNYNIIPFNMTEYSKLRYRFDVQNDKQVSTEFKLAPFHDKILYITNQNNARNYMIDFVQSFFPQLDWILPWDATFFLHSNASQAISQALQPMPPTYQYSVT